MDELKCPHCQSNKYRNPELVMMINNCGHSLCKACVNVVFHRESSKCPYQDCGRTLYKKDFRVQIFEDSRVEKEVGIRKSVLRIYNKLEEDFDNLDDYNDYLEEIEEIIDALENDLDDKDTKLRISQYKLNNAEITRKNEIKIRQKRSETQAKLDGLEKERQNKLDQYRKKEEVLNAKIKERENALVDKLKTGNFDPGDVESFNMDLFNSSTYNSTNNDEEYDQFGDRIIIENEDDEMEICDEPFVYKPVKLDFEGPKIPDNLEEEGYLVHVIESNETAQAGGYISTIACHRALSDAFAGLFHKSSSTANSLY